MASITGGPLYTGMVNPHTLTVVVSTSDVGVDLSGTTSGTLTVTKPGGHNQSWALTVSSASASSVTFTHTLASGELADAGQYRAFATASPSGWQSDSLSFQVLPR